MMNKYIIIMFLIFILQAPADASDINADISALETGVFGYDYNRDSRNRRVERLEEYMYGEKKTGSIQSRVEALKNDSGIAAMPKAKKPMVTFPTGRLEDETAAASNQGGYYLKEDAGVEYKIVDKMEKTLFNQTYKNENIYDRLNRLENAVFQETSKAPLDARTAKLAEVLLPSKNTVQKKMQDFYKEENFFPIEENAFPFELAALEQNLLKKGYAEENNSMRLARLEDKLFKRTFPNDSDVLRLQRLSAAYEADRSASAYAQNRRMQSVAAISQIGGIVLMILAMFL